MAASPATPTSSRSRDPLLAAAHTGTHDPFEQLVEPHRRALHVHCYRMLGSLDDADDALQETLLRAWRALPRFDGRELRAWLYKIATNVCIDLVARLPRRTISLEELPEGQPADHGARPVFLDPYPDQRLGLESGYAAPEARYEQREAVELAFVAALQHLPGRQRAVLILREVLGFSAAEVAPLLETTVASVNSALQRARQTVDKRLPERSQQATLRALGDERLRELVRAFVDAWCQARVDQMISILTDDLIFTMPPEPTCHGKDAIDAFLPILPRQWRLVPIRANGHVAFGAYRLDSASGRHRAAVLDVLFLSGDRIAQVLAFANPQLFARFGLPASLPNR